MATKNSALPRGSKLRGGPGAQNNLGRVNEREPGRLQTSRPSTSFYVITGQGMEITRAKAPSQSLGRRTGMMGPNVNTDSIGAPYHQP